MEMQKIRTVTFCGHSELTNPDAVRVWLMETVESLISQGAVTFYLGGYGAFDRMAASVLQEKKRQHPHIESVLTVYPPLESIPRRFAISKRNEWMVDASDAVVACVTHDWGGAAKTLAYAKRKKKQIILYPERTWCDV